MSRRISAAEYRAELDRRMSEKEWQAELVSIARELGWRAYHPLRSDGSRSGWPDLSLWRDRLILVEVKKQAGRLTAAQVATIAELRAAHPEVYVWRPSDRQEAIEVLTRRAPAVVPSERA